LNPAESYLDEFLTRKLVMLTGKGGVGKSFLSLMLALRAVQQGRKVLLVELTSHSQHQAPLGLEPKRHAIQSYNDKLSHINIIYEYNFRDYIVKYLGMEKVFNQVFNRNIVKSFLRMVPGLNEITFLGRLYFECVVNQENPFDIVIFDGFASGHFHRLLTTPQGIHRAGLVGPVLQETKNIQAFLSNQKDVATVYTCLPEKLVVGEANEFVEKVNQDTDIHVDAIILNRCFRSQLSNWQMEGAVGNYMRHNLQLQKESEESLAKQLTDRCKLIQANDIGPVVGASTPTRFVDHWNEMDFRFFDAHT